jgi:hypothetical protein
MIIRKLFLVLPILPIFIVLLAATPDNTVHFKGVVVYNRTAPPLKALPVSRDRVTCGEAIPDEAVRIHKKGGLQNVFIIIANIAAEKLPPLALNLEIKACRFQPRALVAGAGSELAIRNGDAILHDVKARWQPFADGWNETSTLNIFGDATETAFSFAFPQKNLMAQQKLEKPGLLQLRSDLGHDWMNGYILVMPHRYFAVTDAEGKFELPALPAGRYDLVLWHETLGAKRQIVEAKTADKNALLIKWFPDDSTTANHADSAATN